MEQANKPTGPTTVMLRGRVARGRGEGAAFTAIPWARAAFVARLGIDPFPGTLNRVPEDAAARAATRVDPRGPAGRLGTQTQTAAPKDRRAHFAEFCFWVAIA